MVKIGGILLAAGKSTRMPGELKQLVSISGVPLARRCAEILIKGGISPLVIVIPPRNEALSGSFSGMPAMVVENHKNGDGMSSSLIKGMEHLGGDIDGVAIALADMPLIRPGTVRLLVEGYAGTERNIVYPVYRGKRGHPVLFNLLKYRHRIGGLTGDAGARTIIKENPRDLCEIEVDDPGVIFDIDTHEHLAQWLDKEHTDDEKLL